MASMGLKYAAWAKVKTEPATSNPTYEPGFVLGRVVSTNMSVTNAEGKLHANDMLAEYASEFVSAALTMETDNIELNHQALLYGATFDTTDGLQHFSGDNAPYGGIGGYQIVMVRNVRKYRAWFFPKAKAAIPDWAGATKGENISFGTQPLSLQVLAPEYGPWYIVKEFTTEMAAQAFIDEKLGVAAWHAASIHVQGADGVSRAVSPVGDVFVAEGDALEIAITGTPTALYDNGVDQTAAIAGGVYRVANVQAAHAVAVIF